MIPLFAEAGLRAVAPDLVGFGRSDKPAKRQDYTYGQHVKWIAALVEKLDLRAITLVCQDWGGLIGLRIAAERPARFARCVAANTGLPTGEGPIGDAFMAWRKFSQETPTFPVGQIIQGGCATQLSAEVVAAYDAPFPDERYKAGARQFPVLVPYRTTIPRRRLTARLGKRSIYGRSRFSPRSATAIQLPKAETGFCSLPFRVVATNRILR
jgi:haloalkane dehalogenase